MPLRTAVTLGIPGILGVLSRTAGTVIEGDTQIGILFPLFDRRSGSDVVESECRSLYSIPCCLRGGRGRGEGGERDPEWQVV